MRDDLYHGLKLMAGSPPFPPMMDFIVAFVAEWLMENEGKSAPLAARWREEMGP
jgi:hypothetical protein